MILACICGPHEGDTMVIHDDIMVRVEGKDIPVLEWWLNVAKQRCKKCRERKAVHVAVAERITEPTVAGARGTDPATSWAAAKATPWTRWKRGNQRHLLLWCYGATAGGLTSEEASVAIGFPRAWRRVSELLNASPPLLEWSGATRTGSAGSQQQVLVITAEGKHALAELGAPHAH